MKQLCSWWRSKGVLGPWCWLMDWSTWHMRRVRESWNCVSRVEKALGGSCQCINTWWQREDTAGLLWVSSNRTRDNEDKLKHMKFCLNRRKLLLYGWLNTGTGYPGRSWSVPSWDIFIVSAGHNPGQPALFSIWLCFEKGGLGYLVSRSHFQPELFCDFVTKYLVQQQHTMDLMLMDWKHCHGAAGTKLTEKVLGFITLWGEDGETYGRGRQDKKKDVPSGLNAIATMAMTLASTPTHLPVWIFLDCWKQELASVLFVQSQHNPTC